MTPPPESATSPQLPLRPEFAGMNAYGAPQLPVSVVLNTNENPFGAPADVREAINEAIAANVGSLNRYPDRDAIQLREEIVYWLQHTPTTSAAAATWLTPQRVWAANGSNEILQQLLQAFGGPGHQVLTMSPSYSMHPIIANTTLTRVLDVPRLANFHIDMATVEERIATEQPELVFLCSPNNPTGTATSLADIARLYDTLTATGHPALLVIDEAYVEFSEGQSALDLLPSRPQLVISRTMSKAFGFAGVRLGYVCAHEAVIDALQLVRLPYHLSALTQAAAVAALTHNRELDAQVALLQQLREDVATQLVAAGCTVLPSQANFLLFQDPAWAGDQHRAWQSLVEQNVLVRDVGLAGWLRVTIGTAAENAAFIAALTHTRLAGAEEKAE